MTSPTNCPTRIKDKQAIYTVTHKLLQQLIVLLEKFLTDDRAYTKASVVMSGGTIGKHTRHIYDHYRLLLASNTLVNAQQEWIVDFDARERGQPMETMPGEAIRSLRKIQRQCIGAKRIPLETPLVVAATIDPSEKMPKYHIDSTFERELWYCCMHAIHHYASIKAICIENGIPVAQDFGVAPSTTLYYQHQKSSNGHHRL